MAGQILLGTLPLTEPAAAPPPATSQGGSSPSSVAVSNLCKSSALEPPTTQPLSSNARRGSPWST